MEWSTACLDWESRIVEGRPLVPFGPLFPQEAEDSLKVFGQLRVVDVAGGPRMSQICRPWIMDFVGAVFGAYDGDEGRQMITEYLLSVSKKNAKSTLAAGVMLTALIRNWRESAEFLILAPTIEVANNSFFPARDMIGKDEELSALFHVQPHLRTITHRINGSTLKVVAAEDEAVGGKKATGVLVDELWQFGKRPNAENMLREATGGLASRPEGFTIYLTTQSDDAPAGVWKQRLQYARGVRDGRIKDNRFLPVLYEFPQKMLDEKAYLDRKHFYISNPNLGASVDEEFLVRELAKAEESGEESVCGLLAKHLNVEIGLALKSNSWAGAMFWQQRQNKAISIDHILEVCDVVTVGIDGGGLDDLLGLCVIGRHRDTRKWLVWTHAWAHRIVMERRKSEAARFADFERDGDLSIIADMGQDVDEVVEIVMKVEEAGLLDRVGVDIHGIKAINDALLEAGLERDKIIGISQGWKMVGIVKTTERMLAEGTMEVADSPLMRWSVGNAKVEPRGNAIVITKSASGTAKIDPVMAMFDAAELMSLNPDAPLREPQMYFLGGRKEKPRIAA